MGSYKRTQVLSDLYFYPNTGFVAFTSAHFARTDPIKGFITNVIHITAKSSDPELQFLINELNDTYETIAKLYEQKEAKHV